MTLHHRSKISSAINYSEYYHVNGSMGCCCLRSSTSGLLEAQELSFAACNAQDGHYVIPPQGLTCSSVFCPSGGETGCCCSCSYLTKEQRALVDQDVLNSTYGMRDGIGRCDCEDLGGKWTLGPCGITRPSDFCRKPNGVDVRIPKACCGVTLELLYNETLGYTQENIASYCEDVCNSKECSDNVIFNYVATYYSNGRRCFYHKPNVGGPVASFDCQLNEGDSTTIPVPPFEPSTLPVCNNSNFYCWGNDCPYYVRLIDNGIYTNPTVNDYNTLMRSGGVQKLSDFNNIDEGKNVIGDGLFSPFTENYLYMRARYGKAAFITLDNKVVFSNCEALGFQSGTEYAPVNYTTTPFNKYDRVEIGKNFVVLRKQSNLGTAADLYGFLAAGVTVSQSQLNQNGVLTVHALEEAVCVTKINFLTNNIELVCQGYPFNKTALTVVDGGIAGDYQYSIVPQTVSCNGFHCTYQRLKLDMNRVVQEKKWITSGEYKRTKANNGTIIEVPNGAFTKILLNPESEFANGMVVAGQNFDCFMEAVSQNPDTEEGYTNMSCVGVWYPSDTNQTFSTIDNYQFGTVAQIPGLCGGMFADCDYHKCFAVSPVLEYCEDNRFGTCCRRTSSGCECSQDVTSAQCNGTFYPGSNYTCLNCYEDCDTGDGDPNGDGQDGEDGDGVSLSCLTDTSADGTVTKRGACCVITNCPPDEDGISSVKYSCACRRQGSCELLNGTFYENKAVDEVTCGPADSTGNCCVKIFNGPGLGFNRICLNSPTDIMDCHTCVGVEDGVCTEYSNGGNSIVPGNLWSAAGSCCGC